ncbi:MAG: penicillin-binding protein 2, partial [Actinomycetes bacterium]|nr:penicillin-binding protein 2 [Actinomycetes bacterium]
MKKGSGALFLFSAVLVLCLLSAAGRFVYLQVFDAARLTEAAESQRLRRIETPGARGAIFDREGNELAKSIQVYNIIADPSLITYKQTIARILTQALGGDTATYLKALSREGRYAIVAKKVDPALVDDIKARAEVHKDDSDAQRSLKLELQTLAFELDYKRVYPTDSVGAQVVGFVGGEGTGAAGIEMSYEELLRGTLGVSFSERDAQGNVIPAGLQRTILPTQGSDIMLTIDSAIQYRVQQELKAVTKQYQAASASAIVMNPRNGEIYAAASWPTFNPNSYNKAKPEAIKNRPLTDLLEPGSTMKCITLGAALDSEVVTTKTKFNVPSSIRVGTRTVKDSHDHPTQTMSVSAIIQESSNVGTTRIAQKIGRKKYYSSLKKFGLTEAPGTDFPGSGRGWVPSTDKWNDVSLSNFSFGQGLSMTSVQLARAVAAIANDGVMVTPHFIKAIPSGNESLPQFTEKRVISSQAATQTTAVLKKVMTSGTGKLVKVPGYHVAGKTGTAQKANAKGGGYSDGLYISSFIGYLPAGDPELLVYLMVDEPKAA